MILKVPGDLKRILREVPLEKLRQAIDRGPVEPLDALAETVLKGMQKRLAELGIRAPTGAPAYQFVAGRMTCDEYRAKLDAIDNQTKDPIIRWLVRNELSRLGVLEDALSYYQGSLEVDE